MKKGFTLIELLVVIAIIAILAGLIIIRIGSASADARNSRRRSDLSQIRTAIEQAKNAGTTVNLTGCPAAWPNPTTCNRPLSNNNAFTQSNNSALPTQFLAGSVYPQDPLSTSTSPLYYQIRLVSTTGAAPATPSIDYILVANSTGDGGEIVVGG